MPLKAQCGGLRSLCRRSMDVLDSSRRSAISRRALKAPSWSPVAAGGLSQAASPNKGNAMCLCVPAVTTKDASYSAHSHLGKIVFRHETHICPPVRPSISTPAHPSDYPVAFRDRWNAQHNPSSGFSRGVSSQWAVPRRPPEGGSARSHPQIAFSSFPLMEPRQRPCFFFFLCTRTTHLRRSYQTLGRRPPPLPVSRPQLWAAVKTSINIDFFFFSRRPRLDCL